MTRYAGRNLPLFDETFDPDTLTLAEAPTVVTWPSELSAARPEGIPAPPAPKDPEAWRESARCVDMDPDDFHPSRGEDAKATAAKAICDACPVRVDCLEYAIERPDLEGIWGGVNARGRREIRRRLREEKVA